MSVGTMVRGWFGNHERRIADGYRAFFVDLDAFVAVVKTLSNPARILEVGCGEGAVTERLASTFPTAEIVATDISPRLGRLFRGDLRRVTFTQEDISTTAKRYPRAFDLVVAVDVLHHVQLTHRRQFLTNIAAATAPGGLIVVKEWVRVANVVHFLCWASDRFVTGDAIHYHTRDELLKTARAVMGPDSVCHERCVQPWRNNLVLVLRPGIHLRDPTGPTQS